MKKCLKLFTLMLALSLILTSLPLSFAQSEAPLSPVAGEDYVKGEVLFNVVSSAAQTDSLQALEEDLGIQVLETIDQSALNATTSADALGADEETLFRASFDSEKTTVFELCKALNKLPGIKDAEPNYTYAPDEFVMPSEINSSYLYKSEQKWYFDNMALTSAWQQYETLGEGVVVCVIDNGLNTDHEDIKNRLWDDGNGHYGYNAEFNNHDVYGKLSGGPSHGSHCAGIIAMDANNGGLVGVAPKAKIMACNAVTASTGKFTNANLIKCLEYAVENGAKVISMSLGGYFYSVNMDKALSKASQSAVILCAAGNEGLSAATALHYPSACGAVIGVMALGSGLNTNTLSDYSNYDLTGRYYQVAAPGTNIYAIAAQSTTGYVSKSGTSMATPFMAGIAALYLSKHPEMSAQQARRAIIDAAGEMVAGYYSTTLNLPFKKATPLTLLGVSAAPATAVHLEDRELDSAVRDALQIDSYTQLTNYDLQSVASLDLRNTHFKDYEALSYFTGLSSLNLTDTGMTDADAASLAQYLPDTTLNFVFSSNRLTNLSFFNQYEGFVSRLVVDGNQIESLAGIEKFSMLSDLDVANNRIVNLSPVSSLSGLVYFYAPGNLIEDVTPIINMPSLEQVYFGNYNPNFTDMFGELYFPSGSAGNKISSLEPFMNLSKYSRLHYINLSYNYINLDPLYNYRTAKLMQILDSICQYHDFDSIFGWDVAYKLVISPFAKGSLVFAGDIAFENNRNFATVYLDGSGYQIPYRVLPENANAKTGVSFAIKDSSIAYVNTDGVIFPRAAGSTYITLTLESGAVRTFFVTVSKSFVTQAGMLNPASCYFACVEYRALIYTSPCNELRLSDQNGNSFGSFSSEGKYCYALSDAHGNPFQKWIVPLYAENPGEYDISVSVKATKESSFNATGVGFHFSAKEQFGNELSGIYTMYHSRFDTKVTLLAADDTVLQTLTVNGTGTNTGTYHFYGVANGVYTILIESDGYMPLYMKDIVVNGNTFVDDNIDGGTSLSSCAGDVNSDSNIDIADISVLLAEGNYTMDAAHADNILCDIDADNTVSMNDLWILIANQA